MFGGASTSLPGSAGAAELASLTGAAELAALTGAAELASLTGAAELASLTGAAELASLTGAAELASLTWAVELASLTGTVELASMPGAVELDTSSGGCLDVRRRRGVSCVLFVSGSDCKLLARIMTSLMSMVLGRRNMVWMSPLSASSCSVAAAAVGLGAFCSLAASVAMELGAFCSLAGLHAAVAAGLGAASSFTWLGSASGCGMSTSILCMRFSSSPSRSIGTASWAPSAAGTRAPELFVETSRLASIRPQPSAFIEVATCACVFGPAVSTFTSACMCVVVVVVLAAWAASGCMPRTRHSKLQKISTPSALKFEIDIHSTTCISRSVENAAWTLL